MLMRLLFCTVAARLTSLLSNWGLLYSVKEVL